MIRHAALLLTTILLATYAHGQESKPAVYKVDFTLRGEGTASQHYSIQLDDSRKGVFRAGTRGEGSTGNAGQPIDQGVKIECTAHDADGKVALEGTIERTTVVKQEGMDEPIMGQRILSFRSTAPLGIPTVIVEQTTNLRALTAPAPKQSLEVTITRLN